MRSRTDTDARAIRFTPSVLNRLAPPGVPESVDRTEADLRLIAERYTAPIHAFAYRALGDHGRSEDVVQEVLLRAWRGASGYRPERGSVGAWLYGIARHVIIDLYRADAVRPRTTGDVDLTDVPAAEDLDRALEGWLMAEAIGRLSPAHRAVLVETYYRGASVAEAADRLAVPEGTVKSRSYYALRALRLALEEMGVLDETGVHGQTGVDP
jgi:RNA polymerase sigma-70 factor, ECF subfamily